MGIFFYTTNEHMICPHCQTKGFVMTRDVHKKVGISGSKATAALLTGGLSLFATGLSQKELMKRYAPTASRNGLFSCSINKVLQVQFNQSKS